MNSLMKSNSQTVGGAKYSVLGWGVGVGAMMLMSTIGVFALAALAIGFAMISRRGKWSLIGFVSGIGAMLLFAPLVTVAITATIIILAIIGALMLFMHSEPSSPTSRR